MFFKKPSSVTYTQMAIYVDKTCYEQDRDENLIFQYLYHLFYILAVKKCYFKTSEDYDNYALYGAEEVYRRLTNPKQFLPDDDPKKLPKIKSCLNYIKNILYALRVNYQKFQFGEVFCDESVQDKDVKILEEDIKSRAVSESYSLTKIDTHYYLQKIPNTIKEYLNTSPYSKDKTILKNIYLSCLLTLLSNITWSNANKQTIQARTLKGLDIENLVNKVYEEESKDLILWHLDPSMGNYVKTLINKIKSIIKKDLKFIIGSNEPTDQMVKSIIASPLNELLNNGNNNIDEY